ncbi:hypothetical protein NA57DRAFT_33808 [Rhizodiscina lignyota]|uniref:C2H2-type domain-containing protein n=1 Tax=Rhizodiscina lignyota TaxID=1504668 RepID=A0A9P4IHD1_9PEZI|nr:hypothetical protein NA57DRAFT_33808 [Rhizodiscina lignyota]
MARPSSSHRLSVSSGTSGGAARLSHPRPHTHSLSVGSINSAHRVTRRKSTSSTAVNNAAAMAVAMREASGAPYDASNGTAKRSSSSKSPGTKYGSHPSLPSSLPNHSSDFGPNGYPNAKNNVAVTDGPPLSSLPEKEKSNGKSRIRRASEGSRLTKGESKRGNAPELRCEKCGKGYKHSSCLTKHLWEHTPEWAITSKLLISKHQQVQLLEAASVLVTMNQDGTPTESDHSSASPAASGSTDPREDGMSSADTTPPPDANAPYSTSRPDFTSTKRFSSNSSAYSQSYQSVFSDSASAGRPYVSHYRQWSTDGRPTTSGTSVTGSYRDDDDHADLAAAVGLLSCSYGTPKSGPVMLPADVPPVPPLPAKYTGSKPDTLSGSTTTLTPQYYSATGRNFFHPDRKDIDMDDRSMADEDSDHYNRMRNYEEEEGVFGKMEE